MLASIGYFVLVTKVAPYHIDRYLMPIYPLVYLLTIGMVMWLFFEYMKKSIVVFLCVVGFGGLSLMHLAVSEVAYTYRDATQVRRAVEKENSECYCIYIDDEKPVHQYYDVMQSLKEYKGFCYIASTETDVAGELDILRQEKALILYLGETISPEDAERFLEKELDREFTMELLDSNNAWQTYRIS